MTDELAFQLESLKVQNPSVDPVADDGYDADSDLLDSELEKIAHIRQQLRIFINSPAEDDRALFSPYRAPPSSPIRQSIKVFHFDRMVQASRDSRRDATSQRVLLRRTDALNARRLEFK